MRSYPCPDRCSCHSAGPSTLPPPTTAPPRTPAKTRSSTWNRTAPALFLAALAAPAFAAPAPPPNPDLAFLYPALSRRVTDAGQAPDDPSTGWFTPQNIEVEDLISAGLPMKFVYDPKARPDKSRSPDAIEEEAETLKRGGAWVVDDYWELHGKRYGPHTATADITDNPLPTPTESASSASPTSTATSTSTPTPSLLAIESSLPTGWGDPEYRSSGIYRIPIVVSFAVVIALMIGALIGALVFRRAQRKRRRREKEKLAGTVDGDDDSQRSLREKTVRKSLTARVGRVLRAVHKSELRRRNVQHQTDPQPAELAPTDAEQGEEEVEQARDASDRNDLERRIRSWARRSAAWRVQARTSMRRRIGRGPRREATAADDDDNNGATVASRRSSRPASPVPSIPRSRASLEERRSPVIIVTNATDQEAAVTPTYATPTVPIYSSSPGSGSQPRSSTSNSVTPTTSHDAHPDATPGDEPAYEYGSGLPPAYRRGEGMTEVRRGKMPMREEDVEDLEGGGEGGEGIQMERRGETEREEEGRTWTALDAYAFSREEEGETGVTAHVATDDKQVLERLRGMRGAPGRESEMHAVGEAPREEDVFGVEVERSQEALAVGGSQAFPPPPDSQTRVLPREGESALPSPPAKAGVGPVARYGETDLSLPRYLDGGRVLPVGPSAPLDGEVGSYGPSAPPEELGPSAPPEEFSPSAPPEEIVPSAPLEEIIPSAPPLDDGDDDGDMPGPSAAGESDLFKPSAVSFEDNESGRTLVIPYPRRADSSSPLLEDERLRP